MSLLKVSPLPRTSHFHLPLWQLVTSQTQLMGHINSETISESISSSVSSSSALFHPSASTPVKFPNAHYASLLECLSRIYPKTLKSLKGKNNTLLVRFIFRRRKLKCWHSACSVPCIRTTVDWPALSAAEVRSASHRVRP